MPKRKLQSDSENTTTPPAKKTKAAPKRNKKSNDEESGEYCHLSFLFHITLGGQSVSRGDKVVEVVGWKRGAFPRNDRSAPTAASTMMRHFRLSSARVHL
jgi:hypothetical protein